MGERHSERAAVLELAAECRRPAVRLGDWQTRLSAYLDRYDHRFKYGQHDCFLFVAGAVEAQLGVDVTAGVAYGTRGEAWEAIRERGRNLAEAFGVVVAPYGIRPVAVSFSRRGDPVVIRQGRRGASLGIVGLSARDIITVAGVGIVRLPLSRAIQGFQI